MHLNRLEHLHNNQKRVMRSPRKLILQVLCIRWTNSCMKWKFLEIREQMALLTELKEGEEASMDVVASNKALTAFKATNHTLNTPTMAFLRSQDQFLNCRRQRRITMSSINLDMLARRKVEIWKRNINQYTWLTLRDTTSLRDQASSTRGSKHQPVAIKAPIRCIIG